MKLKYTYETKEEIPADQVQFYVEMNGKWFVDMDGVVPMDRVTELNAKVAEFRKTNIELQKRVQEIEGKKVITVEEFAELEELREKIAKGHKPEELEKLVEQRTDKMRKTHATEIDGHKTRADKAEGSVKRYRTQLQDSRVETALAAVINEIAVPQKGAMPDIYSRTRGTWQLNDEDELVAMDRDGNEMMGKDGKPLTMKEFASDLVTNASHLFEKSQGGGSRNDGQRRPAVGQKVIAASDKDSFGRNLEDIASGKIVVQMDS